MLKKLYVGNLSFNSSETDVREAFEQYGSVQSVHVITDRETGRSKGFGFVEMNDQDATKAIAGLNGAEVNGRLITVNEARPMAQRSSGDGKYRGSMARGPRY